jgi:hypothetical protein
MSIDLYGTVLTLIFRLMSASLIGRLGSSAFRLSAVAVSMSLTGSYFSAESAHEPSILRFEDEVEQSFRRPCRWPDLGVQDVDWDTQDGQYRVRIDGQWLVVPDIAVKCLLSRRSPGEGLSLL